MNTKKKTTVSTTSRIKWIKEVDHKLDGGTITSYDYKVGPYQIHIWQMYNSEHPWNWWLAKNPYFKHGVRFDREELISSPYNGEEDADEAKDRAMRALFFWIALKLLFNTQNPETARERYDAIKTKNNPFGI